MPDSKSDQGGSELQRKDERVTINKEFESYDAFINEYVTNISRSGVFIRTKTPLAVGTRVNLRFTVIMDDIETIEASARSCASTTTRPAWAWSSPSSPATRKASSRSS